MSVPASEVGTVGSSDNTAASAQPTTAATPATGTSIPGGWLQGLADKLNPFSGESFLPNAALVAVGIVLILGALMVSQKQTIVQVAGATAV